MRVPNRTVMATLCLVIIFLIYLSSITLRFQRIVNETYSELLRYEVENAYVGKLRHEIRIVNNSSSSVTGKLFIPLIRNVTAQCFIIFQNNSSAHALMDDDSENIYLYLDDLTIIGDQTFRLEVSYYVLSFEVQYLINAAEGRYDKDLIDKKYTEPEKLIESDNSKIDSLAHNLTTNVNGCNEKAWEIYAFVRHHLQYEVQNEERGALWALDHRTGDCSEYSYLFVALCRAAGIPARIQAGFAFHRSSDIIEDGHMWAEYYLAGYGWIPVDVTWQLFDYIDSRHFSSIQSVPTITPYTNYLFECNSEDNILEEQTISLTPCGVEVFTDDCVETIVNAVYEKNHVKQAIALSKIFGTPLLFPSEVNEIEQTLLQAKIQLQNALKYLGEDQETATSNAIVALERAELIKSSIWILIAKTLAIFMGILLVTILIGSFLVKLSMNRNRISSN